MDKKKATRLKRAKKARSKIRELKLPRLSVHRTPRHIYAQIITHDNKVIVTASSVEKGFRDAHKQTGNVVTATEIGKMIAERALKAKIKQIAFDRSGFKYHGRVKALADAAREAGLEF